jgi:hypothetical protein
MSNTLSDTTLKGKTTVVGQFAAPSGSITNANIATAAGIAASKVVHRFPLNYAQADGASVADATVTLYVAAAAGEVKSVEVGLGGAAAAGDSTVDVDILKSTGGGAFASMLSAAITVDSSTVIRTAEVGVVSSGSYADGDILRVDVDATVGTGTLPQGIVVTVICEENPA